MISVRAEDDKGFGYTNITIVIRFEGQVDFVPFMIIGIVLSLAIIGVTIVYIKIPSWIFARRDRREQKSTIEK